MANDFLDTPGARLRTVREHRNYNQADLAKALGVSQSYLSRIERNEAPIRAMAPRLSALLDVSADYLLMMSDSPVAIDGPPGDLARQEVIDFRQLRTLIDEVPADQRARLVRYLIKQVDIFRELFPQE